MGWVMASVQVKAMARRIPGLVPVGLPMGLYGYRSSFVSRHTNPIAMGRGKATVLVLGTESALESALESESGMVVVLGGNRAHGRDHALRRHRAHDRDHVLHHRLGCCCRIQRYCHSPPSVGWPASIG